MINIASFETLDKGYSTMAGGEPTVLEALWDGEYLPGWYLYLRLTSDNKKNLFY